MLFIFINLLIAPFITLYSAGSLLSMKLRVDCLLHFCGLYATSDDIHLSYSCYGNSHIMFQINLPYSGAQDVPLRELLFSFSVAVTCRNYCRKPE